MSSASGRCCPAAAELRHHDPHRRHVERIMEAVGGTRLRLVRFAERGWDRHQDVWSYQHRST